MRPPHTRAGLNMIIGWKKPLRPPEKRFFATAEHSPEGRQTGATASALYLFLLRSQVIDRSSIFLWSKRREGPYLSLINNFVGGTIFVRERSGGHSPMRGTTFRSTIKLIILCSSKNRKIRRRAKRNVLYSHLPPPPSK